ncbi:hypothetical protein RY27_29605, partial [Litorilinea aerophila]
MKRSPSKRVSRREFMRLSAFATAGVALAACGGGGAAPAPAEPAAPAATAAPAEQAAPAAPAAPPSKFNEAPMLADLVAQGQLPPVDERLPTNPMVMPVAE